MKKERTKRICNYFMKGLLLCALVFGFWFMADAGVNADEVGIPKNFTPGTIEMVPFTKGENSNPYINITNNSDKPVKVTFEHNIAQTDHNYKLRIYVGNHECVSKENPVAKDANVLYLYPYQCIEKACEVVFSSSASSSASVTFNVKAAYLSKEVKKKDQAIGLNKNTAVEIPLSGMQNSLYEGVTGSGEDERWYKFDVKDRAVINPIFELAEKERCSLFHQSQTFIKIYNSRDELVYKEAATQYKGENIWNIGSKTLTSGTYYVKIINNRQAYYPATFMFNLNGHDWIPANGITCSSSEIQLSDIGKKKVIAQTVPANSDDKIVSVYDHLTGKTWDWYNSNTVDYDGIPSTATAPGRHAWITFKTTNGKTFTTYVISPAEKLKKPRVATGYNSAKFWVDYPNKLQTSVRIQVLKKGKWMTAKTLGYFSCGNSNPVTIKGLKPLTNYKFRVQAYANGMTGTPSDIVTMKTGSKKKPAIKSIKIVQRKKVTVKGWWRKHWIGGRISRYEWVPPYTYTKYKVRVTLKKKVPKIGGMWVAGNWVKGSKKSYTVWVPNGAQKGKKLTIRISTALGKGYGNGPEVKKVIRAK
jgi:hypothetical protein